jgi:pimeloyl-ACP methyl ester carboxylesterase
MNAALTLCAGIAAFIAALGAGLAVFTLLLRGRVEAAVPPLGRFVHVGKTRLHVVERGSGPTLVLVHGLGAQLRNFTYALTERLEPHFHLICVDRPGCGYSTRPAGVSASLTGQADTIADLLASLGVRQAIIVGHSYGGAVALALALNRPECVRGLALIAPLTRLQGEPPAVFRDLVIRSRLLRKLIAWTLAAPLSMAKGGKILERVFHPDPVPADFATTVGGLLALRPQQFFAASSDLVGVDRELPPLVARYPSIRVPVGILFGRGDEILSYHEHGIAMQAKIPGLTVSLIDGGHMLPLAAPDLTAQWISELADRCPAVTRA